MAKTPYYNLPLQLKRTPCPLVMRGIFLQKGSLIKKITIPKGVKGFYEH